MGWSTTRSTPMGKIPSSFDLTEKGRWASGWRVNDFVLEQVKVLQRLWRGEKLNFPRAGGKEVGVGIFRGRFLALVNFAIFPFLSRATESGRRGETQCSQ